jgi:hypothetical protein
MQRKDGARTHQPRGQTHGRRSPVAGNGRRTSLLASLVAGALVLAPTLAQATSTRVYTLGAMNRFILDDTNRWLYPQAITRYGNLFYLEMFGTKPSQDASAPGSLRQGATPVAGDLYTLDIADTVAVQQTTGGGAILALTEDLFMSMHLSDYENPTVPTFLTLLGGSSQGGPDALGWTGIAPPDAPASANRKFDLFFAYKLQDLMDVGLQLTYGSSKYRRTPNDNDPDVPADLQGGVEARKTDAISTSEVGILLGVGAAPSDALAFDAALGLTLHGLGYSPNERDNLIDGGGGLEVRGDARAMIGVSEQWELVPALSFRYLGLSGADLANFSTGLIYNDDVGRERFFITDVAWQRVLLDLGVAGHYQASDKVQFWGAVGFQYLRNSASYENTISDAPDAGLVRDQPLEFSRRSVSTDALPYMRLAMEARVFSWLDLRAGVVKYLRADTSVQDDIDDNDAANNKLNDVTRDYPFFDYFVGLAVHHEGLFLDLQLDPLWFQRGPQALSGAAQANMFVNASLGYRF